MALGDDVLGCVENVLVRVSRRRGVMQVSCEW